MLGVAYFSEFNSSFIARLEDKRTGHAVSSFRFQTVTPSISKASCGAVERLPVVRLESQDDLFNVCFFKNFHLFSVFLAVILSGLLILQQALAMTQIV